MADRPAFESPVVGDYPVAGGDLALTDASSVTKLLVRAAEGTAAARGLEVGFGRSRPAGDALVCGQRPGEWMVLGSSRAAEAVIDGLDRTGHVSVVDHTHARAMFRLTGERTTAVLEKVCSLDWADEMTPDGAVVSASVAKVVCDIVRHDVVRRDGGRTPSYLIACDRSFGQYLFDAIVDAGHEHALAVTPPSLDF